MPLIKTFTIEKEVDWDEELMKEEEWDEEDYFEAEFEEIFENEAQKKMEDYISNDVDIYDFDWDSMEFTDIDVYEDY